MSQKIAAGLLEKAELLEKAVNTIQMLAVDGVEKAGCGHPGAPMGLASIAYEIWTQELRYDPKDPAWPNRDRFVLSCGHASMLLYAMLHLSGYDVSLDDLKSFRQWDSKTPGHPEAHMTPGVETTTGPLGQGFANAVGMAASIKMMGARFNGACPGLFDARVFGIASDGDMMEGVSAEACSLAGHLGLDNLVFFYDDNQITIDGSTDLAFSEDVGMRFESAGWFVQRIDGHDHEAIRAALAAAVAEPSRPSLIAARTHIGNGSPAKQDTAKAHGEKLGAEEVVATKNNIGWPLEPTFFVPDEVKALFAERAEHGGERRKTWCAMRDTFVNHGSGDATLYQQLIERQVPDDLLERLVAALPEKPGATRALSGAIQQTVAALVPSLIGGSADLTPSNKTFIGDSLAVTKDSFIGRNLHFGVREHAMGSFANGVALADGFIPYTATFLVFSDYMRPAMRLAALTKLQCLFIFTHDSVYLGEDGPTHQPVEHYWALRAIPNMDLVRPCDALECAAAWTHALRRKNGPTSFALTRQGVPNLSRPEGFEPEQILRGAYVIDGCDGSPDVVIVASGSEVGVAVSAKKLLADSGKKIRVVSAPCWDQFQREDASYREEIIPRSARRVVLEIGVSWPWQGAVGDDGLVIGHDDFGHSAPAKVIQQKLGHDVESVATRIRAWLD